MKILKKLKQYRIRILTERKFNRIKIAAYAKGFAAGSNKYKNILDKSFVENAELEVKLRKAVKND